MPHKLGIHKIIKLNKYDLNVCFIANFYFSKKKKIFVFFLQLKKQKNAMHLLSNTGWEPLDEKRTS
uniref:Uncharacterized protein n=1 Tax=Chlamydia pneumoniae TaxID=83558 RepID=A0A0F7XQ60_CHLPN|nr:hypothetical protein BN1224_U1271_C_02200 [Chlamydia pneumoniae]CRI50410.1 hypothetical protein BN1224_PB1_B_03790 [Chlamydia pneumoniae]